MSTTDTRLNQRPSVKQDVIYARTGNGVIFHNASTGFQLAGASAYDFARKVIPHLNGHSRVLEIRDALPDQHRETFLSLVDSLTRYGFVRTEEPGDEEIELDPRVARHFASQVNYIAHYQGGARRRFAQVRLARVVVLGSDETARWVVLGLLRNGFAHIHAEAALLDERSGGEAIADELRVLAAADIPAELTVLDAADPGWAELSEATAVVVCGDGAATRAAVLLDEGIPPGVSLLSATRVGERVIVGPLMSMQVPGCLTCALLRLGANDEPSRLADCLDLWSGLAGRTTTVPEYRGSRPVAAMLGNLLAYEVFRQVSGLMPPESKGAVIVQHLGSADVTTEPLSVHPRCARCAPLLPATEGELFAIVPEVEPRAEAVEEERDPVEEPRGGRFAALFGPTVGIFNGFEDAKDEQLPVRVGRVVVSVSTGRRRAIAAFDVHTTYAARTRALLAAAAAYALANETAPPADLHDATIAPIEPGRLAIAALERPAGTREWARAVTFLGRSEICVPTAAVYPFGARNGDGVFHRSGAGTVAASTLALAVGGAVLSALGGAALHRRVRDGAVTLIDPASLDGDDQLSYLRASARNLGVEIGLLDIGTPGGPPVVLARALAPTDQAVWAVGTGLTWRQAATQAACETIGQVQVAAAMSAADTGAPVLDAFHPWALSPIRSAAAPLETGTSWEQIRSHLREVGQDLALVDIGGPDLRAGGLRVIRALAFGGGDQ